MTTEIPANLHAYRTALRAAIAEDLTRPAPVRRPRVLLASGTLAAATVATVAVVVATGGPAGPAPAAAAAIVRAITAPQNVILHVKVVGEQSGTQVAGEWWQSTNPPYGARLAKGPVDHRGEEADNGTTSFAYDPASNTIYERPDTSPPQFTDPISQIREELQAGEAHVTGTANVGGVQAYRIALPSGIVGYFDTTDYRPLLLDDPQRDGTIVRLRVVAFEYLPQTPGNLRLLDLKAQHPDAAVDTNPADWPNAGK